MVRLIVQVAVQNRGHDVLRNTFSKFIDQSPLSNSESNTTEQ